MSEQPAVELREVLYEFHQVGNSVRVAAIDPYTRTEVTIVGPANAGAETLQSTARRKLAYVIGKARAQG